MRDVHYADLVKAIGDNGNGLGYQVRSTQPVRELVIDIAMRGFIGTNCDDADHFISHPHWLPANAAK